MKKKGLVLFLIAVMALSTALLAGCGGGPKQESKDNGGAKGNKLVIYTSMKESLISGIVEGIFVLISVNHVLQLFDVICVGRNIRQRFDCTLI